NVQVVTTTGYRDYRDWDKIMYKQVAGNLPVNVYPWVLSGNDVYNTSGKVGIGTSSPATTLDVNGALNLSNTTTTPSINVKNGDAAATFNDNAQIKMGWAGSAAGTSQYAQFIHTRHNAGPTNNAIDFYLSDGTANNTITTGSTRAMSILSPGDVEISGKLTIGNASGNVATKVSGFVNAGTFLSMDNLKVSVTTGGSRGLSVGAVSTNFTANISAYYAMNGGVAGSAAANVAYTTTPSGAAFGWSFPSEGDGSYYNILDKTNNRMYRVTLFIGASYLNNFISIERLY
ncbi:MAG: Cyanophage, partial [Bacteroidota bacterium]